MDFYMLDSPESTRKRAEWDDDIMAFLPEGHDCPVDPEHPTGKTGRACDLHITLPSDKVDDFVWTWYHECLITEKVLRLFREAGLTGYETKPVTVTGLKRGHLGNVPRLHEVVVTGWGGQARKESGIVLLERCPGCGREVYGPILDWTKAIDEKRWDGSDFFVLWPLANFIFVTERVASLVRKHGLKGARVIPLAEIPPNDGCFAGKLERYYPPDVAKARERDLLF